MFAFSIWDQNRQRLFLARDRIGQKPLFYSFKNGSLTFASELRAVLEDSSVSRDIDLASIDDFLNYGYIQAPFSIFRDIKKLPPAHFLVWEKGNMSIERYWKLDYSKKLNLSEEGYCERLRESIKESTMIRLISDVPLGAFLSGGIDSSAVVAMMSGIMDRPVKTFSIGFEDESFDETPYARIISKRFNTLHQEFTVKPDALKILPELIRHFGEPYADSSALPTYYLSKMTRQYVTVALNGDAGDESFGGYERYIANRIAEDFRVPFIVFRKIAGNLIKGISESTDSKDRAFRLKRFINSVLSNKEDTYLRLVSVINDEERNGIYSDYMKKEMGRLARESIISSEYRNSATPDLMDATLFVDIMTYMPGDLLPKVDITSMAHSLEARSPFLDHKFLEFSAQIPSGLKIKRFTTKYILKKALKGILPCDILDRGKMGFGVPIGRWFREELRDYVHEILMSDKCINRGYFTKNGLGRLLDDHLRGRANHGARIWSLLNLELWHRIFIDKENI
jgi:asparagine synthase (glutamine-hydrolysing)